MKKRPSASARTASPLETRNQKPETGNKKLRTAPLVRKILLRQPKPQRVLHLRCHIHKADANISLLIGPSHFHFGLHPALRSRQFEGHPRRLTHIESIPHVHLQSTLA